MQKMALVAHCEALQRLLLAWEANVQERLGYIPESLCSTSRAHVESHLQALEEELRRDLAAVEASLDVVRGGACQAPAALPSASQAWAEEQSSDTAAS